MRISDWSSDVCSSDLFRYGPERANCLGAASLRWKTAIRNGSSGTMHMESDLVRELIEPWRGDHGSPYPTWFLWEERLKNFRSIRRGISQVVAAFESGTFGAAYRGSSLEIMVNSVEIGRASRGDRVGEVV